MSDFTEEAKARWGSTPEFQESFKRTAGRYQSGFMSAQSKCRSSWRLCISRISASRSTTTDACAA